MSPVVGPLLICNEYGWTMCLHIVVSTSQLTYPYMCSCDGVIKMSSYTWCDKTVTLEFVMRQVSMKCVQSLPIHQLASVSVFLHKKTILLVAL